MENEEYRIGDIAAEIINLSKNRLYVKFRYFATALSKLIPVKNEEIPTFGTDGKVLRYNPRHIVLSYKENQDQPEREYIHSVMHCILCHCYTGENTNRLKWDTACDIAVENILDEMGLKYGAQKGKTERDNVVFSLRSKLGVLTAEKIYRYFEKSNKSDRDIYYLESLFAVDEHELWYDNSMAFSSENKGWQKNDGNGSNSDSANGMNGKNGRNGRSTEGNGDRESEVGKGESTSGKGKPKSKSETAREKEDWKRIAEGIKKDIEIFSKNPGNSGGSLIASLDDTVREKYDYKDFLRKFSVRGEAIKTSQDEFDYVFYTYGLSLYGNLPLIEPLEYSDDKKIRDFVIAVDTSGSTNGNLVKAFITKTVGILFESECYFKKVNIHIIQCDSKVQHEDVITDKEDLESFVKNIKIFGGGGTDFRPVFKYVDELIDAKHFNSLKGLVYFTDGIGIFPETKPNYDTAFVFVDEEERKHTVPVWAMKIILRKDEMEEAI